MLRGAAIHGQVAGATLAFLAIGAEAGGAGCQDYSFDWGAAAGAGVACSVVDFVFCAVAAWGVVGVYVIAQG